MSMNGKKFRGKKPVQFTIRGRKGASAEPGKSMEGEERRGPALSLGLRLSDIWMR